MYHSKIFCWLKVFKFVSGMDHGISFSRIGCLMVRIDVHNRKALVEEANCLSNKIQWLAFFGTI